MDKKKQSSLSKAFARPSKGSKQQPDSTTTADAAASGTSLPINVSFHPTDAVHTLSTTGTHVTNGIGNGNRVNNGPSNGTTRKTNGHPISPPDSPDVRFADTAVVLNSNSKRNGIGHKLSKQTLVSSDSSPALQSLPFAGTKHARDLTSMTTTSTISHISAGLSSGVEDTFSSGGEGSGNEGHHITNVGNGYGLNPADILQHRLSAYSDIVKNLQQYFTEVAVVESTISRAWGKASQVLVVPFKDGHQFLGKGGIQDVIAGLRDSCKWQTEHHASTARYVEETVVKHLRRLKQDIKIKGRTIRSDTNLYNNRVFKERELTQERIGILARAIALYEKAGGYEAEENMRSDPYLANLGLKKQLAKQVQEENLFSRALRQVQEEVASFESRIVKEIKRILFAYANVPKRNNAMPSGIDQSWVAPEAALNVLQEKTEWTEFMDRNGYRLLPSELAEADLEELDYPGKQNPFVVPIKTAHLSRKSSVLKNWKDGYFVLTMGGWLHVFTSAQDTAGTETAPDRSIYVPTAVLGKLIETGQKQHMFSLDGKGQGGLLHRDSQTFTVRAHSREEMVEWWTALSKRARSPPATSTHPSRSSTSLDHPSNLQRTLSTKVTKPLIATASAVPGTFTTTTVSAPAIIGIGGDKTSVHELPQAPKVLERTNTGSTVSLNAEDLIAPTIIDDDLPNPFTGDDYDCGFAVAYISELRLRSASNAIREKPLWWVKYKDPLIAARWRQELLEIQDTDDDIHPNNKLTNSHIDYLFKELDWYADYRLKHLLPGSTTNNSSNSNDTHVNTAAIEIAIDCTRRADGLIPHDLKERLMAGTRKLMDVPEHLKDWHPGSNKQVLDLVHPSLFPFIANRTLVVRDRPAIPPLAFVGQGQTEEAKISKETSYDETNHSKKFQWLPTDFSIDIETGRVRFESYINNLHPVEHKELYPVLEEILERFIPMFEDVLTDMRVFTQKENRFPIDTNDWYSHLKMPNFGTDYDSRYEWYKTRVPSPAAVPKEFVPPVEPVRYKLATENNNKHQVIVKLANIELTPENPRYPGGSWHVEGMANENIAASGIYYYDSKNITESRLEFRIHVYEPDYEQNDDLGCKIMYGLENEGALNQRLDGIITKEDRCIAFPNIYQHQVQPFELLDPTQPGTRKILVFFLINPETAVLSTTHVPPQQKDWVPTTGLMEEVERRLPLELVEEIEKLVDWPISMEEAKEHRLELMEERKYFVEEGSRETFERSFYLCEH
ncbi:hypothetical protein BG004_001173 [Podila humilis]|nr:hypothetical protein BG004_001173 [Podila humilis]